MLVKQLKMRQKEKKLLESALTGRGVIRADEGTIRAGENFNATPSFNYFWNTK